ncbi:MAG: tyrosine-type recombinase/integrase [Pseudomonadota bacterium]|nr:hypothetical protein [Pseudomonadota bacterium]QKK05708.1 MAG: tyrosine-type recombinase/integrase [Pseudomonadota bacterium]
MSDYLMQYNGWYYYFRRVPKDLSAYDSRRHIKISLKTKDRATARKRAVVQNEAVEKYWRELLASPDTAKQGRDSLYRKAVTTARLHGFAYRDISDLSENASAAELVDRLLALREAEEKQPEKSQQLQTALLGTADIPKTMLGEAWEIYRPRCADRLLGKTEHQIRKWENPRKLAIENFIEVIGDKPVAEVTRKDVLHFQEWWLRRVTQEGRKPATANKNIGYVKDIVEMVCNVTDVVPDTEITALFAKVKLREGDDSRKSYEADYVQKVFLNSNALDGLNEEARALIYIMADTGARVSEITGLLPEDIRLDTDIPFIHIRNNARGTLKTAQSDRQIPLVGSALYGIKMFPQGLERYASGDTASNVINKFLRENNLSPSEGQSLYSLRHTFKDRLRDIQAPEEVIDNLMGHKSRGPKYGRGHILETKLEWLNKIAFQAPEV